MTLQMMAGRARGKAGRFNPSAGRLDVPRVRGGVTCLGPYPRLGTAWQVTAELNSERNKNSAFAERCAALACASGTGGLGPGLTARSQWTHAVGLNNGLQGTCAMCWGRGLRAQSLRV